MPLCPLYTRSLKSCAVIIAAAQNRLSAAAGLCAHATTKQPYVGEKPIIWPKQLLAARWYAIENRGTYHLFFFSWPSFAACFEMSVAQNGRSVGLFLKYKHRLCIRAPALAHILILVIIYLTFL